MKAIERTSNNQDTTKKQMVKRVTMEQKALLIELLEKDKDLANSNMDPQLGEKWKEIAQQLNALAGAQKSVSLWRKFWTDIRRNTTKKAVVCTEIGRSRRFRITPAPLKDLDNRILAIMRIESNDNMEIVPKEEPSPLNQQIIIDVPDSPSVEDRLAREKQHKRYLRFLRRMDKRVENRWDKLLDIEKQKLEAVRLNNTLLADAVLQMTNMHKNVNGSKTATNGARKLFD